MDDFAGRRRRFSELLGGAAAVVPGARTTFRSRDTQHAFRQDSDFHYLTGFPDPDSIAIFDQDRFHLLVPPRDSEREAWEGERQGLDGARRHGAEPWPIEKLEELLSSLLQAAPRIYFPLYRDARLDHWLSHHLSRRRGAASPEILDPAGPIGELRLFKDEEEIERMARAARISARAHRHVRERIRPGVGESELAALLELELRREGGSGPSYPSIVASGKNATVLHYTGSARTIEAGDLVLIDAGAEFELYAADVTRTHPASGDFSPEQRAVWEIVSEAQEAGIARCVAGRTTEEVHRTAQEVLIRGLKDLGVLSAPVEEILEKELQKPYTIHKTSHFIGLDVHDPGMPPPGAAPRSLAPGMVLTVEPGLYFREGTTCPERLMGIGVRIEDDVLVTGGAPRVLSRP
jgi:Xaa-Pro aminopeptidase